MGIQKLVGLRNFDGHSQVKDGQGWVFRSRMAFTILGLEGNEGQGVAFTILRA